MPITRLSAQALRILEQHPHARIHSVFATVVNLRAGERLITCSRGAISVPHGIEMAPGDLARLRRLHGRAPAAVLDWDPRRHAIVSRSHRLTISSTPQTTVFDPAVPVAEGTSSSESASRLIGYLARTRAVTGLGDEWPALVANRYISRAVASLRGCRVDDAVLHWLGRGPGLTPSGDDMIAGMITALWFTGEIGPSNAALIRQPLEDAARHLTTEISAEYLHCACQGTAPGALRDLLVTLDRSDMAGAIAAVGYLRRFGHTSGMDGLLGAVAVLRHPAARRAHAPMLPPGRATARHLTALGNQRSPLCLSALFSCTLALPCWSTESGSSGRLGPQAVRPPSRFPK